jgi:hypothetical protein
MSAARKIPSPTELLHTWLHDPRALTVGLFAVAGAALAVALFFILRHRRHNEPGLKSPAALALALVIAGAGFAGARQLPDRYYALVAGAFCVLGAGLFLFADAGRYIRDPHGRIVVDLWEIALSFAGFRWTRDKVNRHFFFTGDTGAGKTTGMHRLLDALMRRNPRLGGIVMANKGDEWYFLEWLAKKHGRAGDLVRLRPRLPGETAAPEHRLNITGDARFPYSSRARVLVDTAAALNPKDERSFFKTKGAVHLARALELLHEVGRPVTVTNAYKLLASDAQIEGALAELRKAPPSLRKAELAELFERTYLHHESKEQRAGEIGTTQNYLEYLGTPEIAEVFSSDEPDTCNLADVDRGKIFCIDVPQDYTTERQYLFTVTKLLLYRHALRRYSLPKWERYALNQLVYVGDEFQTAITASQDGTSDFNVVDRLRDCWLTLIVSAQAFESLIPPQTRDQAEVLALNLKNLVMYRAASEADAQRCASAISKHMVERESRSVQRGDTSYTYQRVEEYRIKPHEFRNLPDHTAIVRHCTNGHRKVRLRPA